MVKRKSRLEEAVDFLRVVLADGPVLARVVQQEAAATTDIAPDGLRRARESLGVIARKSRAQDGAWSWELPKD